MPNCVFQRRFPQKNKGRELGVRGVRGEGREGVGGEGVGGGSEGGSEGPNLFEKMWGCR